MNYKTCDDCIHASVCKYKDEKVSLGTTVGEILHKCIDFEHKNDVERVVHCKDCSWAYKVNKYFIYCQKLKKTEHRTCFCAHGERKGDEE